MNNGNAVTRRRPTRNQGLVNLQQGSAGSSGEIISATLFDTMTMAVATLAYDFFTIPQGQAGKTPADTNNLLAGVIPSGQRWTIDMIKIFLEGHATTTDAIQLNINQMLMDTTIEIYLPGKDNLGFWTLAELMGVSSMIAYSATFQGPQPNYMGKYRLQIPLVLAAQTAYKVRLAHHVAINANLADYRLKIGLSGTLERLS